MVAPAVLELIIPALLALFGLMIKNNWLIVIAIAVFLWMSGTFVEVPMYMWVILMIAAMVILLGGKKK